MAVTALAGLDGVGSAGVEIASLRSTNKQRHHEYDKDQSAIYSQVAEERRRLGVRHLARFSQVLWNSRAREGRGHGRWPSVSKLIHGVRQRSAQLPVKADVRKAIGKDQGDRVKVHLKTRIERQSWIAAPARVRNKGRTDNT